MIAARPQWSTDMTGIAWSTAYGALLPDDLPPSMESAAEDIRNEVFPEESPEENRASRWDNWQTMLDRVQVKLTAYNDRLEINGLFDLGELPVRMHRPSSSS